MPSLPNTPDVNPPCMACGTPAYKGNIRVDELGISHGSFICPDGHLWITKWLAVAA